MTTRAERAIKALRDPDHSLANVANTVRQTIAEVIEDQASALERAYGILWRMPSATLHARKVLLEAIEKDGQRRGIAWATEMYGPATEREIVQHAVTLTETDIAALCGGKNARRRVR